MTKSLAFSGVTSLLLISLILSCDRRAEIQTLKVEKGKTFNGLTFKKVFQVDLYGGWCLALPRGFICSELLDRGYKESQLRRYDELGKIIKERRLVHGDGPNEIRVWNFNTVWLSSSGKILTEDSNYLKSLDPETLEIETICKLSNVVEGYGGKYVMGWHGGTALEESEGRTVTSFESTGFYEDMTYYLVTYDGAFNNLRILASPRLARPPGRQKADERKKKKGKPESVLDYYQMLRRTRTFSADWRREIVYFFTDIEKPVIESVDFSGQNRREYLVGMDLDNFGVEREEFDFYHGYVSNQTDPRLKGLFTEVLYIPDHAPALMAIKVFGDRLFIITGNRNWKEKENEVFVYSLPTLEYEGSFFIPFTNMLLIQWYDRYYITRTLVKKDDDYYSSHEIYEVKNNDCTEQSSSGNDQSPTSDEMDGRGYG